MPRILLCQVRRSSLGRRLAAPGRLRLGRTSSRAAPDAADARSHDGDELTVVVCGAGIIGVAVAYFLTQLAPRAGRRVRPIVVDASGAAAGASGMAAGYLPRYLWRNLGEEMHEQGYLLLQRLATELGLQSYAPLPGWLVSLGGSAGGPHADGLPAWIDGDIAGTSSIGETAEVDPKELIQKMLETAQSHGAELLLGTVEGITQEGSSGRQRVTGVVVDGRVVPCDAAVVALGPWSVLAEDWFEGLRVRMRGTLGTVAVYSRPADDLASGIAICERDEHGRALMAVARNNGEMYCLGIKSMKAFSGEELRTLRPAQVMGETTDAEAATGAFQRISSLGGRGEPDEIRAGLRPAMDNGLLPLIGEIPGYSGTGFIACGHNAYGILCGPVTGLALAEQILHGTPSSLDLSAYDPERAEMMARLRGA